MQSHGMLQILLGPMTPYTPFWGLAEINGTMGVAGINGG